jgi:thiol-disulfide isomerase/thioredoxin
VRTARAGLADPEKQLQGFIDKFEPKRRALLRALRKALRKRLPTANELVWDNYNFFVIGYSATERPSDSIVSLVGGASGIGLSFYRGATLPDPEGNPARLGQPEPFHSSRVGREARPSGGPGAHRGCHCSGPNASAPERSSEAHHSDDFGQAETAPKASPFELRGMRSLARALASQNGRGGPMRAWRLLPLVVLLHGDLAAQGPSPSPPPPSPPPDDVRMIRYKISAGDLPSAESILEYHRAEKGEDADYLLGLAWVARGAALTGDWKAASAYAASGRTLALSRLKSPADYDANREAVYLLGTAIEVEAQALVAARKKAEAIRYLEENSRTLEKAPYNLRARIWKRRNLIELEGTAAPPVRAEDHVGAEPPAPDSLRGKPVVLFFWWEACGDCRMQAAALRRTAEKYVPKGVVFVAPTRFYTEDRFEEKQKIEKAWKETYGLPDSVSAPISDEAMLRYGVSATPTFVFVDRKGVVVRYAPTRMTETRLAAAIEALLR